VAAVSARTGALISWVKGRLLIHGRTRVEIPRDNATQIASISMDNSAKLMDLSWLIFFIPTGGELAI
jgi:hypothetical protein